MMESHLPTVSKPSRINPDDSVESTLAGMAQWRPFRGPFERWPHLMDVLIALLAFLLTLLMWSREANWNVVAIDSVGDLWVFIAANVASFALLWRRSHPWQVHAVVLGLSILIFITGPMAGIVAMAFSLYSLGRYENDHRASHIAAAATLVFVVLDVAVFSTPNVGGVIAAMLVLVLWYVGRRLRFRGEYLRLLEERAGHLERERHVESERAVAAERTRIAREMHDVVAHQVSLMTVQAGAARTIHQSDPKAAGEAIAAVETAGRNALREMRDLLGVLRPEQADSRLAPQPGMADIPELIEQVNRTGQNVVLQVSGECHALSKRMELAVFRIVQEALTNVIKHAGENVQVKVDIDGQPKQIVLRIRDNGVGGAHIMNQAGRSGHGIVGMRERAEMLGGSLTAQAGTSGGFEVHAVLPRTTGDV